MMRILKVMLMILVLCIVSTLSIGCGSESDSAAIAEDQVVTVQRGDLVVDITAVGNLAFSYKEELTFEVEGTIGEVLVEEGESIEEGQLLARLDTSEWEEQLKVLEDQLTASERQVTADERQVTAAERQVAAKKRDLLQAQINLQTAKNNLKNTLDKLDEKDSLELALLKSQIDLKTAENNLEEAKEPYTEEDIANAEADVDEAEYVLEYAQWKLDRAWLLREKMTLELEVLRAQQNLDTAQQKLDTMLSGPDEDNVATAEMQVEAAKQSLEQAQKQLDEVAEEVAEEVAGEELQVELAEMRVEEAQNAIADAQKDVEDAQADVEYARADVEDAQEALDEARSASLVIRSPFAGLITTVNVSTGDVVKEGQVAVVLTDPTKFEADILVNEMDIFNIRLGAQASIQLDAVSMIVLPAKVTYISPTASIQSGVVNYKVKVEIQSLESVLQEQQEARQEAMPDISSVELPERLKQAIEEGRITQEQAEEMMKQMQQGQGGQQGMPTMIPEDFQLREGLTVTVSIIVEERNDVLLVPNVAITYKGREAYVQVLKDGVTEPRLITTGISNWQYTEVTDGLSEGEQVVVPQGATTTPTTPQQGGMHIPGMGGFGR